MNRDFDHIKEMFDSDGVKAPDSLSEDNIMAKLPDLDEINEEAFKPVTTKTSTRPKRSLRYIALAACTLIALIGIPHLKDALSAPPETDLINGELKVFENYDEIERLIDSLDTSEPDFLFKTYGSGDSGDVVANGETEVAEDMDMGSAASGSSSVRGSGVADAPLAGPGTSVSEDHSSTYLQVEEVDEADIIKTDGKYIYFVNDREEVVILLTDNGKTKKLATIGNTGVENYIHDIFLKGDTLVTIGTTYEEDDGSTAIVTYDITDRSNPKMIKEFKQSGNIVSSRMIGDYVYLVTNEYVFKGGRTVPMCTANGKYDNIPVSDICCVPEPADTSYVILSAVDISSGKDSKSKTKAIFGASSEIYCNDHNLYSVVTNWNNKDNNGNFSPRTTIIRASLDGLNIKFNKTASVRGYVNNQFSMNEKDGYFYIATTSERDGMDVNNLFVLDPDFKEAGSVSGFARNESIKSVRFLGDKAYVITYEAIDPLFIIDVSDPENPKIEGEVKIDGFSTLLVPVGEGRLLGIGYATGDNGYGGEYASGLKLALFDISNPSKPEVIDSKEFKDMDSPAQDTHLALTVNTAEGWYAIPYGVYKEWLDEDLVIDDEEASEDEDAIDDEEASEDEDVIDGEEIVSDNMETEYEAGVLMFEANDKINVLDQHKLGSSYLSRCVYIGNYIYALDGDANVFSFEVK